MTVFNFVFKRYFRSKSNIIFLAVLPIVSVFFPRAQWLPVPIGFQYYGLLLLFIAARLTGIIMDDRANKTLLRIGVSPITHFQYLWQNLLAYTSILVGLNAVVVITGVLVHRGGLINPFLLFILYSTFSITSIGLSLAWYSLFRNKEAAFSIIGGFYVTMVMVSGVMWPIEAMPVILQRFAMLLPTYWYMDGLLMILQGATLVDLALPLALLIMFGMAFIILGSRRRLY